MPRLHVSHGILRLHTVQYAAYIVPPFLFFILKVHDFGRGTCWSKRRRRVFRLLSSSFEFNCLLSFSSPKPFLWIPREVARRRERGPSLSLFLSFFSPASFALPLRNGHREKFLMQPTQKRRRRRRKGGQTKWVSQWGEEGRRRHPFLHEKRGEEEAERASV